MQQWAIIQKYIQFNLKVQLLGRGLLHTQILLIYIFFSIFAPMLRNNLFQGGKDFSKDTKISLLFQFCYMLLLCWLAWLLITQFHPPELFSLWSVTKFDKKFGIFFLCCAKINIQLQYTAIVHTKVAKSIIFRHSSKEILNLFLGRCLLCISFY